MEYNNPSELIKDLNFGATARNKMKIGVDKLAAAVSSTLGASGKCVIYEDAMGRPVITKDGVTVAESVVLRDPIENIGATLIKEAARNTVREAGDGTTTATVLSHAILTHAYEIIESANLRDLKKGIEKATADVIDQLESAKVDVSGDMLYSVANISTNNDSELAFVISQAFTAVGDNGVVLMEESDTEKTYVEIVDGVQFDSPLKSPHFITDADKERAVLEDPYILIMDSKIPNIRRIQGVLEFVIKQNRPLLIVADMEQQPFGALLMNKVRGNIKVNVVDQPGFGPTRRDTLEDLSAITGAKLISDELGDDIDAISIEALGEAVKAVTDGKSTIITVQDTNELVLERLGVAESKLKNETNHFFKKNIEQRVAMLSGKVGIVRVGANSKIELKEKKDRVEDAIYAVKAAIQEGIIPGGGIALLNASTILTNETNDVGYKVLLDAIKEPFFKIMSNADLDHRDKKYNNMPIGSGVDVVTGDIHNMIEIGIIDPLLVTKTALKNAVSVVSTIVSADAVISNIRIE
jgi:chaperonin GroEL